MQPGDRIKWLHEYRGGWGYRDWIPGEVVKVNPKTLRIRVRLVDGTPVERTVKPEHVKAVPDA